MTIEQERKPHVQDVVEQSVKRAGTPIVGIRNVLLKLIDAIEAITDPAWMDKDTARKCCIDARHMIKQIDELGT